MLLFHGLFQWRGHQLGGSQRIENKVRALQPLVHLDVGVCLGDGAFQLRGHRHRAFHHLANQTRWNLQSLFAGFALDGNWGSHGIESFGESPIMAVGLAEFNHERIQIYSGLPLSGR